MKILTAAQMRRIDERTAGRHGIPSESLMDNAGRAVAEALLRLYPTLGPMKPLIVCGKGNNGGDGITVARHLAARGVAARVVLLARAADLAGTAAHHRDLALAAGIAIEEAPDEKAWGALADGIGAHALIVDAVLGTGLKGAARGLGARAIHDINASRREVVALDIPSGLSGDLAEIPGPAVQADHTIALACPKIPHVFDPAALLVGRLHVVDIGIPAEAVAAEQVALNLITESEIAPLVPMRDADTHKGDYGRVLALAGSTGKSGAAAMVCLSALRSGAGLVTAATALSAQPILASQVMEMMTEALPETPSGTVSRAAAPLLRTLLDRCDVLAIGPGLTMVEETSALVREIIGSTELPVVLDADGINAYAGRPDGIDGTSRVLILTPQPGERPRLLKHDDGTQATGADVQADRAGIARAFAAVHACYLVLKGHRTVIAEPGGEVWINPTGNPGMATGGSGDVLTGVLAGLLAQGLSPLESCLLGVYLHGLAGDMAATGRGETSLIARDIVEHLSEAFLHLERAAE